MITAYYARPDVYYYREIEGRAMKMATRCLYHLVWTIRATYRLPNKRLRVIYFHSFAQRGALSDD